MTEANCRAEAKGIQQHGGGGSRHLRRIFSPASGLLALQATETGLEEVLIAELLLGQVAVAVDHLVVEAPGPALRRAEDVGALVPVLEPARVVPAAVRVRIGDRLHDLV